MGSQTNQVSGGSGQRTDIARAGMRDELDKVEAVRAVVPTNGCDHRFHALNWRPHSLCKYTNTSAIGSL